MLTLHAAAAVRWFFFPTQEQWAREWGMRREWRTRGGGEGESGNERTRESHLRPLGNGRVDSNRYQSGRWAAQPGVITSPVHFFLPPPTPFTLTILYFSFPSTHNREQIVSLIFRAIKHDFHSPTPQRNFYHVTDIGKFFSGHIPLSLLFEKPCWRIQIVRELREILFCFITNYFGLLCLVEGSKMCYNNIN